MKRFLFIIVGLFIILGISFQGFAGIWEAGRIYNLEDATADDSLLITNWEFQDVGKIIVKVITREISTTADYPKFAFVQIVDGYEKCVPFISNGNTKTDSVTVSSGNMFYYNQLGINANSLATQFVVPGDSIYFKWSANECDDGKFTVYFYRKKD